MKKYNNLADLIIDYRSHKGLSQLDLAVILDVDTRTVSRWEKGTTLLNPEIKKSFVEKLLIPHQVIHNLNSTVPISIFYDIEHHTYSLDAVGVQVPNAAWLNSDLPIDDERIQYLSGASDVEIMEAIQEMKVSNKKLSSELLRASVNALPELNLILHDQSGYYAAHLVVLKLKYSAYIKIRNKEMKENEINSSHVSNGSTDDLDVYYFYMHNADSLVNAYYLMNRLFSYFKEKDTKNYIFAAVENKASTIELLKEMGLRTIWIGDENPKGSLTLLEGNFDMFLFGKMR